MSKVIKNTQTVLLQMRILRVFLVFMLFPAVSPAQIIDSVPQFDSYSQSILRTTASRQINNYFFNGYLKSGFQGNSLRFMHISDYSSNTLRASRITTSENYSGKFIFEVPLTQTLAIAATATHTKHTDSRTSDLNAVSQSAAKTSIVFMPYNAVKSSIGIGFQKNTQAQRRDEGLNWDVQLNVPELQTLESNFQGSLSLHEEVTNPRINSNHGLQLLIETIIADSLKNQLDVQYKIQRNDFYLQPDQFVLSQFQTDYNIQKRTEESWGVQEKITNVPIVPEMLYMFFNIGLTQKNIDREFQFYPNDITSTSSLPARILENKFELQSSFRLVLDEFTSAFQLQFQEKHEKYGIIRKSQFIESSFQERLSSELLKNNNAKRYFLSYSGLLPLSSRDNFLFSLSHTKLMYDTPADLNFDDRDELLSIFRFEYVRLFNHFFRSTIRLEGSVNKFTYLLKERSANNYVNRIIKLAFGATYQGAVISTTNYFEVFGNYLVYDFEKYSESIKSFSFRQMMLSDSTSIKINDRTMVNFKGLYKLSEQGNLQWAAFTSQPLRNTEEISLHPEVRTLFKQISFSFGYRFFIVNTFTYKGSVKSLGDVFYSSGPTTAIIANATENLELSMNGWVDNVKSNNQSFSMQLNFQFYLSYKL